MTEQDRRDSTDDEGEQPPAREVRNEVVAETVSMVVQAGSISGGVHHHHQHPPLQQIPVPQQLLAPPRYFVGRTVELAHLTADLDDSAEAGNTVLISALAGAGGIGKTALALHWAHQNLHRFPDGQLFVDLQGFSPTGEPLDPARAILGFLGTLGVPTDRIPLDLQAMATRYRSEVAGRQMLVVLDNAANADQVVPLLPGSPTCTVIVTSRRHLTGLVTRHGAHHLQLGILTDTEARQLLVNWLGTDRITAEPAAVDELLACCGGFALALDIVAARAHMNPRTPLTELATELRDDTTRLGALHNDDPTASLPAVLSWSLRSLTDDQIRVFGLLGIAPGPDISRPAAASLAGLTDDQANTVLRGLERVSLVQQHDTGRYRMHDLVKLFAADQAQQDLPEQARNAALRRLVDFYLHTSYTGHNHLNPRFERLQLDRPVPGCQPQRLPDPMVAMTWFDAEHACLLATHYLGAERGWHRQVWQLTWCLSSFHFRRGYLRDQLAVCRAGLESANRLDDPTSQTLAHLHLGVAYARIGKHALALEHLQRAVSLAERAGDVTHQAAAHFSLSHAWEHGGDYRQALKHATHALRLYQTLDNHPIEVAQVLDGVGYYSARLGNYAEARSRCEDALALHRRYNNREGEAASMDSLGYIARQTGQYTEAVSYYQQSLSLFRSMDNTYVEAEGLEDLAGAHLGLGQHEQARTAWREALELYQQQGRKDDFARVQRQLDNLDHRDGAVRVSE